MESLSDLLLNTLSNPPNASSCMEIGKLVDGNFRFNSSPISSSWVLESKRRAFTNELLPALLQPVSTVMGASSKSAPSSPKERKFLMLNIGFLFVLSILFVVSFSYISKLRWCSNARVSFRKNPERSCLSCTPFHLCWSQQQIHNQRQLIMLLRDGSHPHPLV